MLSPARPLSGMKCGDGRDDELPALLTMLWFDGRMLTEAELDEEGTGGGPICWAAARRSTDARAWGDGGTELRSGILLVRLGSSRFKLGWRIADRISDGSRAQGRTAQVKRTWKPAPGTWGWCKRRLRRIVVRLEFSGRVLPGPQVSDSRPKTNSGNEGGNLAVHATIPHALSIAVHAFGASGCGGSSTAGAPLSAPPPQTPHCKDEGSGQKKRSTLPVRGWYI